MKYSVVKSVTIALAMALSLLTIPNCTYQAERNPKRTETKKAAGSKNHPGFPLPDLKGKMMGPDDYRGKVVLVNFWATWCPPCREEIPDFVEIYKQYHGQGLEILGVAIDDEGATVVKPYAEQVKINYPVLIGNDNLAVTYEIQGIPTTLVLDREGKVHQRLVGQRRRADLEKLIKSLL